MTQALPTTAVLVADGPQLEFEFTLTFELADHDPVMHAVMQRLENTGRMDILVGAGASCTVELQFITTASTAQDALNGASQAVLRAFPGARCTQVLPAPDTPVVDEG